MNEELAFQEATSTGSKTIEHLIKLLASEPVVQVDYREIIDFVVAKLKKANSMVGQTGYMEKDRVLAPAPLSVVALVAVSVQTELTLGFRSQALMLLLLLVLVVVLVLIDLDDALLGFEKMPSSRMDEDKRCKDQKALSQIHLYLSNQILQDVLKETTVATLWLKLESLCMKKSLTKTLEVKYDEEDLGLILLCSLPTSYTTFRDIILYNCDNLTIDEVYDALFSKEKMKHLMNGSETQGYGLIIPEERTRERNSEGDDRNRSKSKNRNKTCNQCKKKGHIKFEYWKLQNREKRKAQKSKKNQPEKSGKANFMEDGSSDRELLVVSYGNSKPYEDWILDSACTFHRCRNRDWFTTYEAISKGALLMGNNTPYKIAGIRTIRIKMFDGVVRTLGDVQYVPELKRNLISLSTLDSNGYSYIGEGGVPKVTKGALVMMKGQRKSINLYILRGLLDRQSITKLEFYEHCIFEKQKRLRFTKGIHSTKGTFDYIHPDL
ncbi:hypothetical protein FXO38_20632 [Capsicum annuum]|nr:hypothetical protein FXO38_20632 [Capsicum annuum]KAF3646006.1 hypothetical protein FXO37_20680 [Capsicum annuum]